MRLVTFASLWLVPLFIFTQSPLLAPASRAVIICGTVAALVECGLSFPVLAVFGLHLVGLIVPNDSSAQSMVVSSSLLISVLMVYYSFGVWPYEASPQTMVNAAIAGLLVSRFF